MASFSLHASQKWPRAGKSAPSWQHIAAMHPKRAGVGKICAPCIRKASQIAFRECTARRSCQGGALFAALAPRIMHGARILPSRRSAKPLECPTAPKLGPEADVTRPHSSAPNRPSARNSSAVCVLRRRTAAREPPVLDHPIREARSRRLHPIDSWAVGIASSSHGIAAALCRHQPVAVGPRRTPPAIADSGTCGDDIRTITVSLVRHAACV